VGIVLGKPAGLIAMNLLLLGVLAFALGCLAILTFLAMLGVMMLAGALRGFGAIRASVGKAGRGLTDVGPLGLAANSLAH
jgi:hypothetical protein